MLRTTRSQLPMELIRQLVGYRNAATEQRLYQLRMRAPRATQLGAPIVLYVMLGTIPSSLEFLSTILLILSNPM